MGVRLSSPKTGFDIYQNLVYPKGAYILHMIRMMMWSPKDGDARFKATMHDFVSTYSLQAATTEDFKAIVEKHMSPAMDLDGNHTMDWFFRRVRLRHDLPTYHFEGTATPSGDGWSLHLKLTQSGVPAEFKMLVPVYLELADGRVMRLGVGQRHGRPHDRKHHAVAQASRAHQARPDQLQLRRAVHGKLERRTALGGAWKGLNLGSPAPRRVPEIVLLLQVEPKARLCAECVVKA